MSISFNCECGKPLKSKEEMAGRKTKCPHCGVILIIPGTPVRTANHPTRTELSHPGHPEALRVEGLDWVTSEVPGIAVAPEPPSSVTLTVATSAVVSTTASDTSKRADPPRPDDGSKQYKVLGQRDHSASGKINFASMEATLNEQAHHGWVMKAAFVINIPGHVGSHDEVVLILER